MFSATASDVADKGETLSDRAEVVLTEAILSGDLSPDTRLVIPTIAARFGIGATPLREALSRLVSRGLVTVTGNKGFRVARADKADLIDLIETRSVVETGAIRKAMLLRDGAWEDRIVAALHRFKRIIASGDASLGDGSPSYHDAHRDFHRALISGCAAPRLIAMHDALFDQAYRYRRIMGAGGIDLNKALVEHVSLADQVMGTDVDAACAAIERHLKLTLEAVFPNEYR